MAVEQKQGVQKQTPTCLATTDDTNQAAVQWGKVVTAQLLPN